MSVRPWRVSERVTVVGGVRSDVIGRGGTYLGYQHDDAGDYHMVRVDGLSVPMWFDDGEIVPVGEESW